MISCVYKRIVNKEEAISQGVSQGEKEVSQRVEEVTLGVEEVTLGAEEVTREEEVIQGEDENSGIQLGGLENILSKIEEMEASIATINGDHYYYMCMIIICMYREKD